MAPRFIKIDYTLIAAVMDDEGWSKDELMKKLRELNIFISDGEWKEIRCIKTYLNAHKQNNLRQGRTE